MHLIDVLARHRVERPEEGRRQRVRRGGATRPTRQEEGLTSPLPPVILELVRLAKLARALREIQDMCNDGLQDVCKYRDGTTARAKSLSRCLCPPRQGCAAPAG